MVFSSVIFLFAFLPLVLAAYYLVPRKGKNICLLLFSLLFYTWGEHELVLIMMTSVLVDFGCALWIEKGYRKTGLAISLIVNLGLLAFFKYASFTFDNYFVLLDLLGIASDTTQKLPHIALPLGISFYTFQTLSYTIDVYKGRVKATHNFIDFAAYVTMFPQLLAGPIVRYKEIAQQLKDRKESASQFVTGIERFIIGLAKKAILADSFAIIADAAFAMQTDDLSMGFAWLGLVAFFFQIYFDFAGYTDMAIGMGNMFGFSFPENFKYPYTARSITKFWQNWHITLSTWFRDYMFFPIVRSGKRTSRLRIYLSIFLVFTTIGFWHGASWNMIIFGALHSAYMIIERINKNVWKIKTPKILDHVYTIWAILMSMVLFRAVSLNHAWQYVKAMYGEGNFSWEWAYPFLNLETLILMIVAIVLSIPTYFGVKNGIENFSRRHPQFQVIFQLSYIIFLLTLLIVCASYIAASVYKPFIYFRF